jgi:hypothetical protein
MPASDSCNSLCSVASIRSVGRRSTSGSTASASRAVLVLQERSRPPTSFPGHTSAAFGQSIAAMQGVTKDADGDRADAALSWRASRAGTQDRGLRRGIFGVQASRARTSLPMARERVAMNRNWLLVRLPFAAYCFVDSMGSPSGIRGVYCNDRVTNRWSTAAVASMPSVAEPHSPEVSVHIDGTTDSNGG